MHACVCAKSLQSCITLKLSKHKIFPQFLTTPNSDYFTRYHILQKKVSDLASGLAFHLLKGTHSIMATRMPREVYLGSKSISWHEKSTHQHRPVSKMAKRKPNALWEQAGACVKGEAFLQADQESHAKQIQPLHDLSRQRSHVRGARTSRSAGINYSACS